MVQRVNEGNGMTSQFALQHGKIIHEKMTVMQGGQRTTGTDGWSSEMKQRIPTENTLIALAGQESMEGPFCN